MRDDLGIDYQSITLRAEDLADDSGTISAVTEAQVLEISGRLGAAKLALLRGLTQTSTPAMRRAMRTAYGSVDEAIRLAQDIVAASGRR